MATWSSPTVSLSPSISCSGSTRGPAVDSEVEVVVLSPTLLFLLPYEVSSPLQSTGSQRSWQNWTVATKLTVGVLGNLKACRTEKEALAGAE